MTRSNKYKRSRANEMLYIFICLKVVLVSVCVRGVLSEPKPKLNKPIVEVVTGPTDEADDYYVVAEKNDDHTVEKDEYDEEVPPPSKSHHLIPPYADVPVEYRRVCIYPNWSVLRDSNMAKIFPEDIDPHLCTHIHYAYANIDVRTFQLTPSQYQDFNSGDHGAVN